MKNVLLLTCTYPHESGPLGLLGRTLEAGKWRMCICISIVQFAPANSNYVTCISNSKPSPLDFPFSHLLSAISNSLYVAQFFVPLWVQNSRVQLYFKVTTARHLSVWNLIYFWSNSKCIFYWSSWLHLFHVIST